MIVTTSHSAEVEKLQKALERQRQNQQDDNQLASLQEEIEALRAELERSRDERKIVEDSYMSEKQQLQQVSLLFPLAWLFKR